MKHKQILYELRKLNILIKRELDSERRNAKIDFPMTRLQGEVIIFIISSKQDIFQKDIEKHLNIRRSTATNLLNTMEKNGLIKRETVQSDARLKKIAVTPRAIEITDNFHNHFFRMENKLSKNLTKQQKDEFLEMLKIMQQNMLVLDKN